MIKTLLGILYSFGKIGIISLGGGNSMLKLLEYEAVTYRQWIGQEEFISMLGVSFLFPGLTAVKLAALIGYKVAGLFGMILALISLNIPGLILAVLGYQLLASHQHPAINTLMIAVQYGALALLAAATFSVASGVVKTHFSISIALASFIFFICLAFWNVSPFWGFMVFILLCFFLVT